MDRLAIEGRRDSGHDSVLGLSDQAGGGARS